MANGRIERDFCSDIHLADILAERKRLRVNWWAVLGIALVVITATLFWVQVARTF